MSDDVGPSRVTRVIDYIFGRNTLIGIASFMLLIISGYATWHGMRDFIVGVSATPAAPNAGGLSISNDVLVIAVVVALTFLMWLTLRENLETFGDIAEWARLVTGPVTPEIADADRDFIARARELLPQEPWGETTWGDWTGALKAATGRKGRELFLPLRMALTGRHDGPELKALLPLIGRKACLDRLS